VSHNLDFKAFMLPFHKAVESDFSAVNDLIIANLHSNVGLVENIGHYIVGSGGKRLRPVVVLLSALANGYKGKQHLTMAAVIEFIHTATLLHDDVVDVSALRRGRETANNQWGNAPSVLVGDFIYSRAFQMLVEVGDMPIMGVIADATNVISEGEVQQMGNAGNSAVDEATYYEVIYRKTAKLFEAAGRIGAMLAAKENHNADRDFHGSDAMAAYGKHLGLAFQIADDVLDYQGDSEETGKNVGDDLAEGKMTLPLIHARDHLGEEQKQLICAAIESKSAEHFEKILEAVRQSSSLDYSVIQAQEQAELAKQSLARLPESKLKTVLFDLADFAVARIS
jgi:octaprenyl-diphosphate synthase